MKKLVSSWEYRMNKKYEYKPQTREDVFTEDIVPVTKDVVVNGRIMKELEFVKVNRSEENAKYKVSDFYLENLLALGADLKPITLQGSTIENTDAIMNGLVDLDAYESSVNVENNPTENNVE